MVQYHLYDWHDSHCTIVTCVVAEYDLLFNFPQNP